MYDKELATHKILEDKVINIPLSVTAKGFMLSIGIGSCTPAGCCGWFTPASCGWYTLSSCGCCAAAAAAGCE